MATYVLPQTEVHIDFDLAPTSALHPAYAHLSGGHAHLQRYSETDERAAGLLGYYERTDQCYSWPGRPAGGIVDESYTEVLIANALLKYYEDLISSGSTSILRVAGYTNRLRANNINFKANGDDYPLSAVLGDRGAKIGDVVKARSIHEGTPYTLWTYIKDIVGDVVAAIIATSREDDDNSTTTANTVSVQKTAGAANCITLDADGSEYDGRASGYIQETYTVKVLESSAGGDLSSATISVTSASGTDDVASLNPAASGSPTDIGTRGLTLTFNVDSADACSVSAEDESAAPDDLIAGQTWVLVVTQQYSPPTTSSGGDYTGEVDTTYIVEVTTGGDYGTAKVSISTTTGVDISGPTVVTAEDTDIVVGTQGVTIQFTGGANGLRKGDKWYIDVTAEGVGNMRTLVLGHNLNENIPDGNDFDLTLFIRVPELSLPANRTGQAPLVNWTQSSTEICINGDVSTFHDEWTVDDEQVALDVYSEESQGYGKVYVTYRAWLQDLVGEVAAIDDVGNLDDLISGPTHPDNPLKYGLFRALENSNGTIVRFSAVSDPNDSDTWVDMLKTLAGRDDVYNLVPLSHEDQVLDLFAAHVDAMSIPTRKQRRVCWFALNAVPSKVIADASDTDDEEPILAVLEDDPDTSGSQYTRLRITSGNIKLDTAGVKAGDIVRYQYVGDGFGNYTYTTYVVDSVVNEETILLATGNSVAVNEPQKVEFHRNLSAAVEAEEIGAQAAARSNTRVRCIWPSGIEDDGTEIDGMFLCASLAGLSSGILPQQGMTRLEIAGYTATPNNDRFTLDDLNTMAGMGVWIVTRDRASGKIYSRHAITSKVDGTLDEREEMMIRNSDSIAYRFHEHFDPLIGVTNVTPNLLSMLRVEILSLVEVLKGELFTPTLGGQLVDATIQDLRISPVFRDRVILRLSCEGPAPFNNFEIHLVF